MTTKEWLMRAWRIDNEIEAMLVAKQRAYERCVSITSPPREAVVMSSHDHDAPLVALANIEEKINQRIDELYQIKSEIQDAIEKVSDSTLRTLLIERYINFKTWEQIAVDMGYSYCNVIQYLHPKALSKIKSTGES